MVNESEFREFCTDTTYSSRSLEEYDGEIMCIIEEGQSVTEVVYDGDTITHSNVTVEVDASDARVYRNKITTRQSATTVTGGSTLTIDEDYEHLL